MLLLPLDIATLILDLVKLAATSANILDDLQKHVKAFFGAFKDKLLKAGDSDPFTQGKVTARLLVDLIITVINLIKGGAKLFQRFGKGGIGKGGKTGQAHSMSEEGAGKPSNAPDYDVSKRFSPEQVGEVPDGKLPPSDTAHGSTKKEISEDLGQSRNPNQPPRKEPHGKVLDERGKIWEAKVRAHTRGVRSKHNVPDGRGGIVEIEIDAETPTELIDAKTLATDIKIGNFKSKSTRTQIDRQVTLGQSLGKSVVWWLETEPDNPEIRQYLERKGIIVRIGL